MSMRATFEAWAQRDGHIVRRREDKPDEYLVFETQRRWAIWQAALAHGQAAAAAPAARPAAAPQRAAQPAHSGAPARDEADLRSEVLNEVLSAFGDLDDSASLDAVLQVVQRLKQKRQAALT